MFYSILITTLIVLERQMKSRMDQLLSFGKEKKVLKGRIILQKYYNKGISLSRLSNHTGFVKIITGTIIGILCLLLAILLRKEGRNFYKLGMSLILGGAISNLADRIKKGHVIDYFSFNYGKKLKNIVFNLADMWIILGGMLIVVGSLFRKE